MNRRATKGLNKTLRWYAIVVDLSIMGSARPELHNRLNCEHHMPQALLDRSMRQSAYMLAFLFEHCAWRGVPEQKENGSAVRKQGYR
jgi:hypothetical protein